jgi:hypothetical protein
MGGGERHPSSCGICLFLARTAARLLDRVASLTVFARLRGGGAGCSGCDTCCGDLQGHGEDEAGCGGIGGAVGYGGVSANGAA